MKSYEDRSCKAWFEYAEPGLLTNRTIRNFLNSYVTEKWPDVVKLTLLYGIVTLRQSMGVAVVPLEKIRQKISRSEAAFCVEEKLLPIQEKVQVLKGDVQEILEAFAENNPKPVAEQAQTKSVFITALLMQAQLPMVVDKGYIQTICSEPTKSANIYPEWWGDGSNEKEEVEPNVARNVPRRSPPRLCYSIPKEQICADLVDDIVEPKYSLVHSSNVGNYHQEKQETNVKPTLPKHNEDEFRTIANIAESFLDNKWTSALCNNRSGTVSQDVGHESNASQKCNTLHSTSPPQSASFWIDLTPVSEKQEPIRKYNSLIYHAKYNAESRAPRGGVMLDFGHLNSPRFPPKGFGKHSKRSSPFKEAPSDESNKSMTVREMLRSVTASSSSPPVTVGLDTYSSASDSTQFSESI